MNTSPNLYRRINLKKSSNNSLQERPAPAQEINQEVEDVEAIEVEFDDTNLRALEDPELVRQVVDSYVSSIDDEMNKLNKALTTEDMENSRFVIHSIQGLSGNIGAISVYKDARELGSHIKKKGFDGCDKIFTSLVKTSQISTKKLLEFVQE